MSLQLHFFILACITGISFKVAAQNIPLSDFEETEIPAPYTTAWYPLNNSKTSFTVSIINKKLNVSKARRSDRIEYDLKEGKLYAINNGEFGGGLYYKPNDTTIKQIYVNGNLQDKTVPMGNKIPMLAGVQYNEDRFGFLNGAIYLSHGNYQKIFSFNNSVYIQSGTTHMGFIEGNFSKLTKDQTGFTITSMLDMDDCPMAFCIFKNTIYLAGFKSFRIINNWKDKIVKQDLFWQTLNPNSVAVSNAQTVYIGIRSGFVQLNSITGEIKFYKYKF